MPVCDFFHVDCTIPLKRIDAFFVMEIAARRLLILDDTANPNEP